MGRSTAWLIELGDTCRAAIGEPEMAHVAAAPLSLYSVPRAPRHCQHVLVWERRIVPVMDLNAWLDETSAASSQRLFGITNYQTTAGDSVCHGALAMSGLPTRIEVDDEQACELPSEQPAWRNLAVSCFDLRGESIPILDLPRIFSVPLTNAP